MQAPLPAAEVRAELARVLARTELREHESLLERLLEWLAPHLSTGEVQTLGDVFLWLFVAGTLAAALVIVRRAWSTFRAPARAREDVPRRAEADTHERLYALAAAARDARARGDLRQAVRLGLHALLHAWGGRGDLELNPSWTNREILRRGQASREARALLEPLVKELEPKEFGRAPVSAADVEHLERLLAPHLARAGGAS